MSKTPAEYHNSWARQRKQNGDHFATTQWSIVAQAGDFDDQHSRDALQVLCQSYWFPLYAYARRRMDAEKSKDMTQEFFCVLLDKNYLESADKQKGQFRAFLLTAFKRFLANQHDRENTIKRGGKILKLSLDFESADSRYSLHPVEDATPDKVFERQWVLTLLENVMDRMREYYQSKGEQQLRRFESLKPMIIGETDLSYAELGEQLDASIESLRVQVHRMRQKYQSTLRSEIAATIADNEDVDDEIRRLFELMG